MTIDKKTIDIRRITAIAAVFFLSLAIVCGTAVSTFADDGDEVQADDGYEPSEYALGNEKINEWEDRVLIAATGKLKNEGRVYYAYGDYVDELVSYFTKDDLDLTEKDARNAIAEITDPANAKAGAQSGYLYQIGGKPKDSESLVNNAEYDGKVYPEFDSSVRFANEEEYRASDLYRNNKAYIDERSNTVYESQSAMRKEMKKLAAADRTYQDILASKPADADMTGIGEQKGPGIAFAVAAAILLILTAAVAVYGWRNGTISALNDIDTESWNRSNSRKDRHRIRKTTAAILAAVVAVDLVIVYAGLTYYSTFGSDNYIEGAIEEGGICEHCYMGFRDDVHDYLGDNSLPKNSLDRALVYRDYKFDYKKGVRSAIKNGSADVVYRGVHDSVESQIDLLAYVTKKDSRKVVKDINKLYENSLSAEAGVIIHGIRANMKGAFTAGFILSIISVLIAAVMLVFERHNVYRGIKDLAVGAIAGTALWGIITGVFAAAGKSFECKLADDYSYVLMTAATSGLGTVMLTLLGISAVVSLLLFGASWLMQRKA